MSAEAHTCTAMSSQSDSLADTPAFHADMYSSVRHRWVHFVSVSVEVMWPVLKSIVKFHVAA